MFNAKPKPNLHNIENSQNPLDILAGPTDAENMMADLAKIRKEVHPEEVAGAIARSVLDQHQSATSVVTKRAHILKRDPGAALATGIGMTATVVGLVSAMSMDVGIMGGSAHELFEDNHWLFPMLSGLLVYGTGLYASTGRKWMHGTVVALGMTASMAAATVMSDNAKYVTHYQSAVSDLFDKTNAESDKAQTALAVAKDKLAKDNERDKSLKLTLYGDGLPNGVKGIVNNGYKGDDDQIPSLLQEVRELEKTEPATPDHPAQISILDADNTAVATTQNAYNVTARQNPARIYGRELTFLAFMAPLATSLLVFDLILGKAKRREEKYKADLTMLNKMEDLVSGLGNPATMRSTAVKETEKSMARIDRIMTVAAKDNPEKVDKFAGLFTGANRVNVRETAIEIILGSLTGEASWASTAPNLHREQQAWAKDQYGPDVMEEPVVLAPTEPAAEPAAPVVEPVAAEVEAATPVAADKNADGARKAGAEAETEAPSPDAAAVAPGAVHNGHDAGARAETWPESIVQPAANDHANGKGGNGKDRSEAPDAAAPAEPTPTPKPLRPRGQIVIDLGGGDDDGGDGGTGKDVQVTHKVKWAEPQ